MEKAYDLKDLGLKMQAEGLTIAEESLEKAAAIAYKAIKQWATESAVLSENKLDDVLAPFYNQLDPIVLPLIESIDFNKDGK